MILRNFTFKQPTSGDFLVGYNESGSQEFKTTVDALLSSEIATSTTIKSVSSKWDSAYSTVNSLSTTWEESADIIPTVTNYLSSNNVSISGINLKQGGLISDGFLYNTGSLTNIGSSYLSANSTNPTVKITQNGFGDALVVEDISNDASPFVINRNGTVVIGASASSVPSTNSVGLQIVSTASLNRTLSLRSHTNSSLLTQGGAILNFTRTRALIPNDFNNSAYNLSAGDVLGVIQFGQNTFTNVQIIAGNKYNRLSSDPATVGGTLQFGTALSGGSMQTNNLTLNEGKVGIGVGSPPEALSVSGNISAISFSNENEQLGCAALSITQAGSAFAFRVSDLSGGDPSSFIIDSGGNTYIGCGVNQPAGYRAIYGNDRDLTGPKLIVNGGIIAGGFGNEVARPDHPNISYGPSFAFGGGTEGCRALAPVSFCEGFDTTCLSAAEAAHAEGIETIAGGTGSHAEGERNQALGNNSHAEGQYTIATGQASHAEGANTIASKGASHAEGNATTATGDTSHAEGFRTQTGANKEYLTYTASTKVFTFAPSVSANFAFASQPGTIIRGFSNDVTGDIFTVYVASRNSTTGAISALKITDPSNSVEITDSFSGYLIDGSGSYAHAEGYGTVASGTNSHAEGENTVANGITSHAAGYRATAAQLYTYAWSDGNVGTLTQNVSTTRTGQYMVSASGGVFIPGRVGIGTDSIANALTVVGNISSNGVVYAQTVGPIGLSAVQHTFVTLTLNEISELVTVNNSVSSIVIIPADSTTNFANGSQVNVCRIGTGTVVVSASPGVFLRSADDKKELRVQYSTATVVKLSANDWLLFGDIV